jgi:hypothetical protein
VPERDRGYSWILRELLPVFPGSEFHDEGAEDVFALAALGVAAVMSRGASETHSIVPWPLRPSAAGGPVVLGTFSPSFDQVRQWAYAPDMRLTAQDEVAAVSSPVYLPVLLELASDPKCPKRQYLLGIVDGYVASARNGVYDRKLLAEIRDLAARSSAADIRAWASDLGYLADYLDGHGPVSEGTACEIARITMLGRYRPNLELNESRAGDWWEFTAKCPDPGPVDRLYVHSGTGALRWSRDARTEGNLAGFANPARRDDPLRMPAK